MMIYWNFKHCFRKTEIAWKNEGNWKARYSKLYSTRRASKVIEDDDPISRISFLSNESCLNRSFRRPSVQRDSSVDGEAKTSVATLTSDVNTILSQSNDCYQGSASSSIRNYGPTDTLLLDMVRAMSQDLTNEEAQDKTLKLPGDDVSEASEPCIHGLSARHTDRSMTVSRRSMSRVSRMSTRRDMDIPSILAFTASVVPAPAPLEIPAFQKANAASPTEDIPRWSIRRALCPVCSQKWRDKSSINNIKSSGLKRMYSADIPSVMAPARLRSSITTDYAPRPMLTVVDENAGFRVMRNNSASWQLTRARRFRAPKIQLPPEATAPPSSTAPMARKDLDNRVNRFLNDEGMAKYQSDSVNNYHNV